MNTPNPQQTNGSGKSAAPPVKPTPSDGAPTAKEEGVEAPASAPEAPVSSSTKDGSNDPMSRSQRVQ